jgi:four helix bundle protein
MNNIQKSKPYDLEERTRLFAKDVITFVNTAPKTMANMENIKQLIRPSGSVGANYIEGNESISKKDFGLRIKICRKEAKESRYWLDLIETRGETVEKERHALIGEATELLKIFNSIVEKSK